MRFEEWVARQTIKPNKSALWCPRCKTWWNNDGFLKGRCLKCGSMLVGNKGGYDHEMF